MSGLVRTDSILDRIAADKAADLVRAEATRPLGEVRAAAERSPRPRDFAAALRRSRPGIIAEIKRRSPSKGTLAENVDPAALALAYAGGGADAVSVLTEVHHFGGSLDDLAAARSAVEVPLLRKDFLFSPYHLYEARAVGADAVLLIVAMLEQSALSDLIGLAEGLGLAALVEVHTADEVERGLAAGARLVGINNRNLHTFSVDLTVTEQLAPLVPPDRTVVGESGVHTASDAARLSAAGVHALLVGESLVRTGTADIAGKIAELRASARSGVQV